MTITIRSLRPGDGAALLVLVRSLAEHHGYAEHLVATSEMYEQEFFKQNALVGALVAEEQGELVGCAIWHRSFSTFRGQDIMYLEDLSVRESHRGRGIGKLLMQAVARLALAEGFPSIFWIMMGWNTEGRRFYERLGAEIEDGNCFCRLSGTALEELSQ